VSSGTFSLSFGSRNVSNGFRSSAFGYGNQATDLNCSSFGWETRSTGSNSSAFGHYARTTDANTAEFGHWRQYNERSASVRMNESGMLALTVQNRATAYNDGGATDGSEAENSLPRKMYTLRRNGLEFILDFNDSGGVVRSLSLGTVS
jgi:cytolysin (calcineurin-like family phosphatase)